MKDEKITVLATESGQSMEVTILSKRADRIEVLIGEGPHSVRCDLLPTRTGQAYAGNVMGREIVYRKTRDEVQAEVEHARRGPMKSIR